MVSENILRLIKEANNIGIFLSDLNDIDLVASAVSLALMLKSEGKNVDVISPQIQFKNILTYFLVITFHSKMKYQVKSL
jgi:nanoRNase/pAp phosphatase (c-di-AMP/oligoRNAs hydrolase)